MEKFISDVMHPPAGRLDSSESVAKAALRMLEVGRRWLPVTDGSGRLVGVVTAESLLVCESDSISDCIVEAPVVVDASESPLEAVRKLIDARSNYLLVCREGRLVGELTWHETEDYLGERLA